MALSYVLYTSSGATQYDITFSYIAESHIKAYVNNVEDSSFTFINSSRIQLSSTPAVGAIVKIERNTPTNAKLIDFQDGATILESDLDTSADQNFFIATENVDAIGDCLKLDNTGVFDAESKRIINVATPTAGTDATNKTYIDTQTTSAATSATNSANSATASASSAAAALVSKTAAETAKTAAELAETNAETAETNSETAQAASETAKTASETAKTAAELAETNAETAETNAETAEANSLTYKNAAETAKTAAETAKTAAETAKTDAETAETNAAASYDSFDDRYLGAKSSDPTLDNDSNALIDGALYFNSTNNVMMVYDLGNTTWNRTTPTSSDQTAINTVNSNSSNINTVSGISGNVTTVAGISSDVTAVANISSDIAAVENKLTEIEAVADDLAEATSEIDVVAGSIANIDTVAGISSDISSLVDALEKTYVVTVAGSVFVLDGDSNPAIEMFRGNTYIFDVSDSSVSGHPLAFKDGSGNSWTSGVTTTGTAGNSGAKVSFEVPSTATSSMRYYCTTHGNSMGNTITVKDSNISLVAGSIANVNLTGGSITNVNSVGGSISNVNTVASNLSGVNSFGERYKVDTTNPSSSLDEGDLFFNTTDNQLKYYNGTSWASITAGIGSVADDTTPQLGGALDVNGNAIVSASNADIAITPNGSGDVILDGLKYPQADGTANQFLKTDGNAQLAFATVDLTALSATNLTTGTIPDGRFPATLPAASGENLTSLPAENLTGTVAEARLPASALGSVWSTKTSAFNAVVRNNYFVDTSSAAITATLPASATAGDEVHFLDVSGTFDTNNLTVARNSHKIQGASSDLTVDTERAGFTLVYSGATQGWLLKHV